MPGTSIETTKLTSITQNSIAIACSLPSHEQQREPRYSPLRHPQILRNYLLPLAQRQTSTSSLNLSRNHIKNDCKRVQNTSHAPKQSPSNNYSSTLRRLEPSHQIDLYESVYNLDTVCYRLRRSATSKSRQSRALQPSYSFVSIRGSCQRALLISQQFQPCQRLNRSASTLLPLLGPLQSRQQRAPNASAPLPPLRPLRATNTVGS